MAKILDTMKLWESVKTTDPAAVKPITGKAYKGNSPKPYWLIERATQEFGPVGIGWGVTVKSERFERLTETDVLHVAVVSVWFVRDGKRSETFDQMGGTKAAYRSKNGMVVDEDAGKKSVTDGMVKCLSMIGFAGDIFSGMWDDSKYVEWAAQQFVDDTQEESQPKTLKHAPRDGIGDDLAPAIKAVLQDLADSCSELVAGGDPRAAYLRLEAEALEADQKTWLWGRLDAKTRRLIKDASKTPIQYDEKQAKEIA